MLCLPNKVVAPRLKGMSRSRSFKPYPKRVCQWQWWMLWCLGSSPAIPCRSSEAQVEALVRAQPPGCRDLDVDLPAVDNASYNSRCGAGGVEHSIPNPYHLHTTRSRRREIKIEDTRNYILFERNTYNVTSDCLYARCDSKLHANALWALVTVGLMCLCVIGGNLKPSPRRTSAFPTFQLLSPIISIARPPCEDQLESERNI